MRTSSPTRFQRFNKILTSEKFKRNNEYQQQLIQLLESHIITEPLAFLNKIRNLKAHHSLIAKLTKHDVGLFFINAIKYHAKTPEQRAQRYIDIIQDLRELLYNDDLINQYWDHATKIAITNKMLVTIDQLYSNSYNNINDINLEDQLVCNLFSRFIANCKLPHHTSTINFYHNNIEIFNKFCTIHKQFLVLNYDNFNNPNIFNFKEVSCQQLSMELCAMLNLIPSIEIFLADHTINPQILAAIKKNITENKSAINIQKFFRGFKARLDLKATDQYGVKYLSYQKNNEQQKFVIINHEGFELIEKKASGIQAAGSFKAVEMINSNTVILKQFTSEERSPFNNLERANIFRALRIEQFFVENYQLNQNRFITHNAGNDLDELCCKTKDSYYLSIPFVSFIPLIKAIDILHQNGYFHLDIKSGNIVAKYVDSNEEIKLAFIDHTSLSTVNNLVEYAGTPHYMQWDLFKKNFTENGLPDYNSLRIQDLYAFTLSILEIIIGSQLGDSEIPLGKMQTLNNKYGEKHEIAAITGLTKITPEIELFIKQYVNPVNRSAFELLIRAPQLYINHPKHNQLTYSQLWNL